MRFRLYGIALGVFFALGLVFSFGVESSAQQRAADTDKTNKSQMSDFLSYVVGDYNQIWEDPDLTGSEKDRRLVILGRQFRQDDGNYKNDDLYTLGISDAGEYVTNHSGHPGLYAYEFKKDSKEAMDSSVTTALNKLIDMSDEGVENIYCQTYGQEGRYACAVKVGSPAGLVTVVAGLHHELNDSPFSLPAICNNLMLDNIAADVVDEATLTAYVKDVIKESQGLVKSIVDDIIAAGSANSDGEFQMQIGQGLGSIAACFAEGDLKYGNIYSFIMDTDEKGTVFLNGNNFDLNGRDLDVTDSQLPGDDKKVSTLFRNALTCGSGGNPEEGDYATVYYRWSDPLNSSKDNPAFVNDNTVIPGTADKTGYIEVADLFKTVENFPPQLYIFGSGIYPSGGNPETPDPDTPYVCAEAETKTDDDDGCAIAGTGHTPQGALLNLLLTASVLFSVVFLRRRA